MSILPKLTYGFSVIAIKIPAVSFIETDKLIPKVIWKCKMPRIAKTTIEKKNKVG